MVVNVHLSQQTPTNLEETHLVIPAQRAEIAELRAKVVALDASLRRVLRPAFAPGAEGIPEIGQTVIPEFLAHTTEVLRQELRTVEDSASTTPTKGCGPAAYDAAAVATPKAVANGIPAAGARLIPSSKPRPVVGGDSKPCRITWSRSSRPSPFPRRHSGGRTAVGWCRWGMNGLNGWNGSQAS